MKNKRRKNYCKRHRCKWNSTFNRTIKKQDTKVVTIFLRVPKDELQKRLESRIDKPSPKEIQLRLNRFDFEESKIGIYDYVIKNNDLEKRYL